jgi:hypothetical protein
MRQTLRLAQRWVREKFGSVVALDTTVAGKTWATAE